MVRFAVTISLVGQARGGPFVFWDNLADSMRQAAALGFDAVEIFAPAADTISRPELRSLLQETGLQVAAVGTGAGMVLHQLQLTDPDPQRRQQAIDFIREMIAFGAEVHAPAIIGSMQGRFVPSEGREVALQRLAEGLRELSAFAESLGVRLLYEPLNRYETNLFQHLETAAAFLQAEQLANVRLLADLFHMNIEETDLAAAIRAAGTRIGHVHFVDSNRQAAGRGHLDFGPLVQALRAVDYQGYVSAEAFPIPSPEAAAAQTIATYRALFGNGGA